MRESIQARLSKYVLRAQSRCDATARHALFGIAGCRRASAPRRAALPDRPHDVVTADGVGITRLPVDRYLVLGRPNRADAVRAGLNQYARREDESCWSRLDIEAGIAVITGETQEEFVPQMVNLDLIGGVSYTKGCYPGQEIVARMHYLGQLKQRLYRAHASLAGTRARRGAGDSVSTEPPNLAGRSGPVER